MFSNQQAASQLQSAYPYSTFSESIQSLL